MNAIIHRRTDPHHQSVRFTDPSPSQVHRHDHHHQPVRSPNPPNPADQSGSTPAGLESAVSAVVSSLYAVFAADYRRGMPAGFPNQGIFTGIKILSAVFSRTHTPAPALPTGEDAGCMLFISAAYNDTSLCTQNDTSSVSADRAGLSFSMVAAHAAYMLLTLLTKRPLTRARHPGQIDHHNDRRLF
ncbi:hypothetical protein Mpal_1612 [Methanosphaerula palustris E1-9c]|uniref:Uncharacterized protein n=1 Tax=Methanosphaerula palustris (strain ATCC BAA-1556 / DSM 19958 / E1-9c) TaxID=521011 RepID=B8GIW1_METPE|nr:hypothetical protein Mpal_1612 [Methanosphaerula palustris E1-9c]